MLPNLLVGDIAAAVRASNAVKVYVCNVATEPGETDGYSLADHVTSLNSNVGPGLFQYTLVNNNTNLGVQPGSGSRIVECDPAVQVELLETGVQAVMADVVDHHDSTTLAAALVQLYEEASQKTPTPLAAARY